MLIGIDIDGTITGNEDFFRSLILGGSFDAEGITILTTAWPNAWNDGHTTYGDYVDLVCRINQLEALGIPRNKYGKVVSIMRESNHPGVAVGKGEYCRDHSIRYMFEDDPDYTEHIKNISPGTTVFLIKQ